MAHKLKVAVTTTECERCGSSLTLETDAEQRDGFEWFAWDGDKATCDDCGLAHYVHVTGDDNAQINAVHNENDPPAEIVELEGGRLGIQLPPIPSMPSAPRVADAEKDTHVDVLAVNLPMAKVAMRRLVGAGYALHALDEFLADYCARYENAKRVHAFELELEDFRKRFVALAKELNL